MSEHTTTVESPPACSTPEETVRPVRRRLAVVLSTPSVSHLGAVTLAALVVYLVAVVPTDFALLLAATLAAVAVVALVPLAAVAAVVWLVE